MTWRNDVRRIGGSTPAAGTWTVARATHSSADEIWDALMPETRASEATERLEIHNASVDEEVARARLCGHLHLPTGGTCILPHAHAGSCHFLSPDDARQVAHSRST